MKLNRVLNIPKNFVKLYSVFQKLRPFDMQYIKIMTFLFKHIKLILEFYYRPNSLTILRNFTNVRIWLENCAKFQGDRFIIDGEIDEAT